MLKEITAIVRPTRAEAVKQAMDEIGAIAYTETAVYGRGRQTGFRFYRLTETGTAPTEAGIRFFAKKLLIFVVPDSLAKRAVQAILKAAKTDAIGDGKVFVSPVGDAIRVRTGQEQAAF